MQKAIGSKKDLRNDAQLKEYYSYVKDLLENDVVMQMKKFRHHYGTNCYQHSINVSYYNYLLCKKFGLDAKSGARAGLLHDLFLYDRKAYIRTKGERLHGFRHPKIALENANANFDLNEREEDIIEKHMWPLTVELPKYSESYVTVLVDKYCAVAEIGSFVLDRTKNKISYLYDKMADKN